MRKNTIVELNRDIGCNLLTFLDGVDAINFIEAVNDSEQFHSIAKTLDHHFIQLISTFCNHQRILLPRGIFESFTGESEIDDERLIVVSTHYSSVIEPSERLYIHPCFSTEGFLKLCKVYKTSLFKCYSRLLPFNNFCYNADFGLLNYELYAHTIGSERILNDHEKNLFRVNTYFDTKKNQNDHSHLFFVRTVDEFKQNFAARFSSTTWLDAIDFSKLAIVGGCVLNALCTSPFSDTKEQDVNLIYYADDIEDFDTTVETTIDNLNKKIWPDLKNKIKVEKVPGASSYNLFLPCHVQLNISWISIGSSKNPLSHILHNFDMDICQVAFTGNKIVTTFPFLQALATKSFIVYSLHARTPKHVCTRIEKYCNRGFDLLEPINFDGNFDLLMAQQEIPQYRVEQHQYTDEDGEIQIATTEFRRMTPPNVDTYRLQEQFISMVCPQLL